jgi:DNA-binding Xre family transcriptional regulator
MTPALRILADAVALNHRIKTSRLMSNDRGDKIWSARASWVHAIKRLLDFSYQEIKRETCIDPRTAKKNFERVCSLIVLRDWREITTFEACKAALEDLRKLPVLETPRPALAIPDASAVQLHAGARICAAREGLSVRRNSLAREIGMSDRNLRRIENGEAVMSITTLRVLCLELGISADEVLGIGKAAAAE